MCDFPVPVHHRQTVHVTACPYIAFPVGEYCQDNVVAVAVYSETTLALRLHVISYESGAVHTEPENPVSAGFDCHGLVYGTVQPVLLRTGIQP